MNKREKTYRGTFLKSNGMLIGLDFYADNRGLALDHASTVARDEKLAVVKVKRLHADDVFDAGSFYPVEKEKP